MVGAIFGAEPSKNCALDQHQIFRLDHNNRTYYRKGPDLVRHTYIGLTTPRPFKNLILWKMTLYLQHEFYKTGANEELHEKPFSLYGPTCSFLILDKLNEAGIFSPNNDFYVK